MRAFSRVGFALTGLCAALGMSPGARADQFSGDVAILSQQPGLVSYEITDRGTNGSLKQTIVPQQAPGSTDLWNPRDLAFDSAGKLYLFNGTFDPYLSIYTPSTSTWTHRTFPGWQTINNVSYGGLALSGNKVFVTDNLGATTGVVVFDVVQNTSSEFATNLAPTDLNVGLDGKLWVLNNGSAFAYNPVTFAAMGSVSLAAAGSDIRSLAVDASGNFYVADWGGKVSRLNSAGGLVSSFTFAFNLIDVDVTASRRVFVGTRLNGTYYTDTNLTSPLQIEADRWNSFVAPIPEPTTLTLASLLALGALRRSRV